MQTFDDYLLVRALHDLDAKLCEQNVKPFTLHVVGGFALLLWGIRKNGEEYTDIDYIGKSFSSDIQDIIGSIGMKYGFGTDWINNDIMLAGSSLEEMEYATGPLHFKPFMNLSVIKVMALYKEDLLRLKLIALDTSLLGSAFGGQFTRYKDFNDIIALMNELQMDIEDLEQYEEYLMNPEIIDLVEVYSMTEDSRKQIVMKQEINNFIEDQKEKNEKITDKLFEDYAI